jgi:hypothetical protein
VQAGDHQRASEAAALPTGVDADDVDLTERVGLVGRCRGVDLRPAEAGDAAVVPREEEPGRVEPRLGDPRPKRVDRPAPLVGIVRERAVVDGQPRLVIEAGAEGADLDIGRPLWRFGDR